jgi:hypothetical protein
LYHDDPNARFLPKEEPDEDEDALGLGVCLLGHMPTDWPDRAKVIEIVHGIFQRADKLGGKLTLPKGLP